MFLTICFNCVSKKFQSLWGSLKYISGKFQRNFKSLWCFRGLSNKVQGGFKRVLIIFQRFFMYVWLKGVSIAFLKSFTKIVKVLQTIFNFFPKLPSSLVKINLLPSSAKPQQQPQLQPSWLSLSLILHFIHPPTHPVPVDSKLQLGQDSSSSPSWLSKQP